MRLKRLLVGGAVALMLGGGLIGTGQAALAHGPQPTAPPSAEPTPSPVPPTCKPSSRPDLPSTCPPPAPRPRPGDPRYTG